MWWDDDRDGKDMQRWKNMSFLKFWGTNAERDELFSSPFFIVAVLFAVIVAVVIALCGK